jgi:hypothetical protein
MLSPPRTRQSLVLTLLLITGCFGETSADCNILAANGLAGNGTFHYDCVGNGDPECDDRAVLALDLGGDLPTKPIARGARFRMEYLGSTTPVRAASPTAGRGPIFTARGRDSMGFFAKAPSDSGEIDDAIRLAVAEPEVLSIHPLGVGGLFGPIEIGPSRTLLFRATAKGNGRSLVGSLPVAWTVDLPEVATIEPGDPGTCTLTAVGEGKATLRATFGALEAELAILVVPASETFDGGLDGSAEGGDADADADVVDAGGDQ